MPYKHSACTAITVATLGHWHYTGATLILRRYQQIIRVQFLKFARSSASSAREWKNGAGTHEHFPLSTFHASMVSPPYTVSYWSRLNAVQSERSGADCISNGRNRLNRNSPVLADRQGELHQRRRRLLPLSSTNPAAPTGEPRSQHERNL